jgi:hypothetical protein
VTHHSILPAREHGRHFSCARADQRTNAVDAAMHDLKAPTTDPAIDRSPGQTHLRQLGSGNDTVLRRSQLIDPRFGMQLFRD